MLHTIFYVRSTCRKELCQMFTIQKWNLRIRECLYINSFHWPKKNHFYSTRNKVQWEQTLLEMWWIPVQNVFFQCVFSTEFFIIFHISGIFILWYIRDFLSLPSAASDPVFTSVQVLQAISAIFSLRKKFSLGKYPKWRILFKKKMPHLMHQFSTQKFFYTVVILILSFNSDLLQF